jgi:hypothetical protein
MTEYLLTIFQPDGPPPPEVDLDAVMAELAALNDELRDAGAFVFSGGLHPPSTATVLRARGGDVVMTDGPFAEAKEHVGGFTIIKADDLDGALRWARRLAEITGLPIEVRPFHDQA